MRTQNGEMFSGKTFDDNNNLEILKKSLVDSNKHPLDTYNIWKRSLVDTKWKRSWIRSNLSDGARQRFIIPTFSKISPVFFFSLGIFLSPWGDLGIGMVSGNHPPLSHPIQHFGRSVEIFSKLSQTNYDGFPDVLRCSTDVFRCVFRLMCRLWLFLGVVKWKYWLWWSKRI